MFGFASPEELMAAAANPMFATAEGREQFFLEMARDGAVRDFVSEARRSDGSALWVSQNTRAIRDNDGRIVHYEGMVVDITDRKCAEERLIHQALHDPLTGLPNRSLFLHRLQHAIAGGRQGAAAGFALLFIDCDRFKVVNDSLGHLAGDRLLVMLGHRIAGCLRGGDTLARLGGDEFAVLIEDAMPGGAWALADRLHQACQRPIDLDDRQVFVSVSIGITLGSADYESPSEMLRDADTAMFRAKARGRGTTAVFERGMHLEAVSRLQMETELRQALERGELRVHYQPIWLLAGNTIAGFEALVRWQHEERGLVFPPGEFIPIAEETGLIVPLGDWVLREACRQLAVWRQQFGTLADSLFMSVNLAPVQLGQSDLVDRTAAALDMANLSGRHLKLEVTETAMMGNPQDVQAKLTALHQLGIRLCIDDFGTGYSLLSQLQTYPFDTLKIDRSFIARIANGRECLEMVRTIVMLGRNLRLSVVAEGVETALQCEWLVAAGCTYAQGYFLSPPVEPQAATALLVGEREDSERAVVND
jgi:diguanylate cyclase (GGDEF)-like protein/PAS domain S-box-containing protein